MRGFFVFTFLLSYGEASNSDSCQNVGEIPRDLKNLIESTRKERAGANEVIQPAERAEEENFLITFEPYTVSSSTGAYDIFIFRHNLKFDSVRQNYTWKKTFLFNWNNKYNFYSFQCFSHQSTGFYVFSRNSEIKNFAVLKRQAFEVKVKFLADLVDVYDHYNKLSAVCVDDTALVDAIKFDHFHPVALCFEGLYKANERGYVRKEWLTLEDVPKIRRAETPPNYSEVTMLPEFNVITLLRQLRIIIKVISGPVASKGSLHTLKEAFQRNFGDADAKRLAEVPPIDTIRSFFLQIYDESLNKI